LKGEIPRLKDKNVDKKEGDEEWKKQLLELNGKL